MRRRNSTPSFADIVRQVRDQEQRPSGPRRPARPGIADDGSLIAPDGTRYRREADDLSADQARAAGRAGALAAWDPCGCGGTCGMLWRDRQDVGDAADRAAPVVERTKRHRGRISRWRADDGTTLLLAEESVTWEGLFGPGGG